MLLIVLVIAACGGPSGNLASASPAARSSVSPTPSTIVPSNSPTASPIASPASPSPAPTASLSPSPVTKSWYPWLPPIDTTVDPILRLDSFVTVRTDVVPVSATPGGPPFRFDTGDPDPSTHPLVGFPKDGLFVVLHGPVVIDDIQWYLFTPAQLAIDIPTGWSPLWTRDGTSYFQRRAFECPTSPMTTARLSRIVLTDGLPSCYGDREITIVGDLRCTAEADSFATGASWLAGSICRFDSPPSVYGLDPDLAPGRYAVTGHFLDEQARACRSIDGGESPLDRLQAVLHCRRAFVATSADPA
jgi:hypothetical protein